jgi:hypothetical protein
MVAQLDATVAVTVTAFIHPFAEFNVEAADIAVARYHTSKLNDPLPSVLRTII